MIDEYRVNLFKKKIRAAIPGGENIRFERSIGRSALIINIWRAYGRDACEECFALIENSLRSARIDYSVRGMFRDSERDYVSVPIDQEALPERARRRKESP